MTDSFKQQGRSGLTNYMEFTNNAVNVIESGAQADVVYTGIRKGKHLQRIV